MPCCHPVYPRWTLKSLLELVTKSGRTLSNCQALVHNPQSRGRGLTIKSTPGLVLTGYGMFRTPFSIVCTTSVKHLSFKNVTRLAALVLKFGPDPLTWDFILTQAYQYICEHCEKLNYSCWWYYHLIINHLIIIT